MSKRKPPSFMIATTQNRCPVCGEISYSRAGVHPQCSVRQADDENATALKSAREQAKANKTPTVAKAVSRFKKNCPKCGASLHVRKAICMCGHRFAAQPPPQA